MKPDTFGLLACLPVRWLITSEPELRDRVADFIRGKWGRPTIKLAGPPLLADMLRAKPGQRPMLPEVTLHLKMGKNSLTHEPGVAVTASDADLDVIVEWFKSAQAKAAAKARAGLVRAA